MQCKAGVPRGTVFNQDRGEPAMFGRLWELFRRYFRGDMYDDDVFEHLEEDDDFEDGEVFVGTSGHCDVCGKWTTNAAIVINSEMTAQLCNKCKAEQGLS